MHTVHKRQGLFSLPNQTPPHHYLLGKAVEGNITTKRLEYKPETFNFIGNIKEPRQEQIGEKKEKVILYWENLKQDAR